MHTPSLFDAGDDAPTAAPPKPARPTPRPLPAPLDDLTPVRRANPLADVEASNLERWLAEFSRGEFGEDELMRAVRGTLYLLDAAQLLAVGRLVIQLARGSNEGA